MKQQYSQAFRSVRRMVLLVCVLLSALLSAEAGVVVQTEVLPLSWDAAPGFLPNPDAFLPDGYWDSSIDVNLRRERRANSNFVAAFVKVKHASQLRTGLATGLGSRYNKTSAMAQHYHAVVAINGDFYVDRKRGLTIRQGELLRETLSKQHDVLLIDREGNFHVVPREQPELLEVFLSGALSIQNAFSFGPALVVDGKARDIPERYNFAPRYKNPRTAIGQLGELSYVFVVVDGRQESSEGVALETLARYMEEIGCQQAFNLDGGGSSTMVLGGEIVNGKSYENERSVSDILYFATSIDPFLWGGTVAGE